MPMRHGQKSTDANLPSFQEDPDSWRSNSDADLDLFKFLYGNSESSVNFYYKP